MDDMRKYLLNDCPKREEGENEEKKGEESPLLG